MRLVLPGVLHMVENDDPEIRLASKLLSEICTYYKHAPTDMEADLWMVTAREFTVPVLRRALMEHVGRSEFMPRIGEIRKALGAVGTSSAEAAFECVRIQVERVGPYRSPNFEDPAIGLALLDMGGWSYVNEVMPCPMTKQFDYQSMAKRFAVAYERARAKLTRGEASPVAVRGLHYLNRADERQNRLLESPSSAPRIAG